MRIFAFDAKPAMRALDDLNAYVRDGRDESRLTDPLIELVETRVSQINGCAFCVGLHSRRAVAAGYSADRLNLLTVWRHAPDFSDDERLVLEWAEAVTGGRPDDGLYERALAAFGEGDLRRLTYAVAAINAWNRIAVSLGTNPVRRAQ